MSRYIWRIISVCLLWALSLPAYSDDSHDGKSKKAVEKPQAVLYGCYVDLDVMDPIIHVFDDTRNGLDASLEVDLFHRIYPTFVLGYQSYDASGKYDYPIPAEDASYQVDGLYFKVGLSVNIWKKNYFKKLNPISYFGLNFGCAPNFDAKIGGYPIDNGYWNSKNGEVPMLSYDGKSLARWGEALVGMKAPIAGHFCLGVEVLFKALLYSKAKDETAYKIHYSYVPGYGSEKNGRWGFRYTLSYYFSFYKGNSTADETY